MISSSNGSSSWGREEDPLDAPGLLPACPPCFLFDAALPDDFDAAQVDPTSVRFGIAGAADTDELATPEDADGDGDIDATLEFLTGDTGIACNYTNASLVGETFSGQPLQGMAGITTNCNANCHD